MLLHSGSLTTIRFMLVEEGFARILDGVVNIEPVFSDTLRLALQSSPASPESE